MIFAESCLSHFIKLRVKFPFTLFGKTFYAFWERFFFLISWMHDEKRRMGHGLWWCFTQCEYTYIYIRNVKSAMPCRNVYQTYTYVRKSNYVSLKNMCILLKRSIKTKIIFNTHAHQKRKIEKLVRTMYMCTVIRNVMFVCC